MKLGEIKIQALKLMFITYTEDPNPEDLTELGSDSNYRAYLINMNGAIDRCIADIERRRILPAKMQDLAPSAPPVEGYMTRCEVTAEDFYDVDRISKEGLFEYDGNHPYMREGNTILINSYDPSARYRMLYFPKIRRASLLRDGDELDVPEEIAAVIPYYVKGDLYREDEPNEASEARNWYEAALASFERPVANKQGRVASAFSQVW